MESLIGVLPIALVALACPLLMLVLMRGMHGGHSGHGSHEAPRPQASGHSADGRNAGDTATAEKLQAMEQEIAALRREVATKQARDGR